MNDRLSAIALASQQLGLLCVRLQGRAASLETPEDENNEIALKLPLLSEQRRDLDREYNALLSGVSQVPPPTQVEIDELSEATQEISDAIAADEATEVLFGLADKVMATAKTLT